LNAANTNKSKADVYWDTYMFNYSKPIR